MKWKTFILCIIFTSEMLIKLGVTQLKGKKSGKWGIERASPVRYPIFRYLHIELRKSYKHKSGCPLYILTRFLYSTCGFLTLAFYDVDAIGKKTMNKS
jgi:hypothetical protein